MTSTKDIYEMAAYLCKGLQLANSIEAFASCRDNIYGDIETAMDRLGPIGQVMSDYNAETCEILSYDEALAAASLLMGTKL